MSPEFFPLPPAPAGGIPYLPWSQDRRYKALWYQCVSRETHWYQSRGVGDNVIHSDLRILFHVKRR